MKKVKEFIADVKKTATEVSWPDKKTLIQLTVVVIFISAVTGTVLAVADFAFTKLITFISLK